LTATDYTQGCSLVLEEATIELLGDMLGESIAEMVRASTAQLKKGKAYGAMHFCGSIYFPT
jgi:hypothetical protein